MNRKNHICPICGAAFQGPEYKVYCSAECRDENKRRQEKARYTVKHKTMPDGGFRLNALMWAAKEMGMACQYSRFSAALTPEREQEIYQEYRAELARRRKERKNGRADPV